MDSFYSQATSEKTCDWAACIVLLMHALLLGWSSTWQSPTLNEPAHLASGVALWELGRFDAYRVNPPLVRAVAAIPVMIYGCKTNWTRLTCGPGERPEFTIGMDFVKANGLNSIHLFNLARWACIPFSVLGGLCCYLWGRSLCNPVSGLLACLLWCFSPTVLAAGQVIAPDMGGASFGLLASYTFWKWLSRPSWERTFVAGGVFGIALLAKSTWVILFALWPLFWIAYYLIKARIAEPVPHIRSQAARLLLIIGLALYVLNTGYLFDGTLTPLGDFEFVSQRLGHPTEQERTGNVFRSSWLSGLPVPLPREFVLGIDHQKKDFEAFPFPSYLRGEWRETSWWYYYLYGFVVKFPLSVLCLILITACMAITEAKHGNVDDIFGWITLCIPGLVMIVMLSCQPSLNHHFRYALPAFGSLFVLAGSLPFTIRRLPTRYHFILHSLTIACAVSLVSTTLASAPRFQSFFNILVGGARNGHHHLIHSNLDWGQDLYFLKTWLKENEIKQPIHLAYHGFFDPADIGINYLPAACGPIWNDRTPSTEDTSNLWIISVNYLTGDRWRLSHGCDYQEFQKKTPIHICGDSLYVFVVP